MFGEAESESPRVPSPWDSLIESSSPPSPGPGQAQAQAPAQAPSPLSKELIPRLVPESDDGNVEYKLQLLNPSPARFARLVTQMKWRLLEGGGQAYYELGVADSGELIGLPRDELEQSLETLEMMAGEIGASVIVVKEIEVPANFSTLAKRNGEWAMSGSYRENGISLSSLDGGYSTPYTTETEQDSLSGTDLDASGDDAEDLSVTVVLDRDPPQNSIVVTSSSSRTTLTGENDDPGENADDERLSVPSNTFRVDLEISQVFKPRPMLARMQHPSHHPTGGKSKRNKKHPSNNGPSTNNKSTTATKMEQNYHNNKSQNRRHARDKRREEKRKALETRAADALDPEAAPDINTDPPTETDAPLVASLNGLNLEEVPNTTIPTAVTEPEFIFGTANAEDFNEDDDDDVFGSPMTAAPSFPTFSALTTGESHLDVDTTAIGIAGVLTNEAGNEETRLIVEALVVRKMSIEEGFLDFGGFQMI